MTKKIYLMSAPSKLDLSEITTAAALYTSIPFPEADIVEPTV